MPTTSQIEANRENLKKSTGPVTLCQRAEDSKNGFERQKRKKAAPLPANTPLDSNELQEVMSQATRQLAAEKLNKLADAA
jgi:hypothetical protein